MLRWNDIAYWIDPKGGVHSTQGEDHGVWAARYLSPPGSWNSLKRMADRVHPYDALETFMEQGWLRVSDLTGIQYGAAPPRKALAKYVDMLLEHITAKPHSTDFASVYVDTAAVSRQMPTEVLVRSYGSKEARDKWIELHPERINSASKKVNRMLIVHPDSHVHADLKPEHVAWALKKFGDRTSFFKETVEMPRSLPALNDALYGPVAGDPPVDESEVRYVARGEGRQGESRMVDRPFRKTRAMTVIAGPHDGHPMVVYTMYGGYSAEREPFDPDIRDEAARQRSVEFWSQHALATGKKAPRANAPTATLRDVLTKAGYPRYTAEKIAQFVAESHPELLRRSNGGPNPTREKQLSQVATALRQAGLSSGEVATAIAAIRAHAGMVKAGQAVKREAGRLGASIKAGIAHHKASRAKKAPRDNVGDGASTTPSDIPVAVKELSPSARQFYNDLFERTTGKPRSATNRWTHIVTHEEETHPGWVISTFIWYLDGFEVARKVFEEHPTSEDSPPRPGIDDDDVRDNPRRKRNNPKRKRTRAHRDNPNCIQLINKETGQPESFQSIDDQMREHFGAEPDPKNWFYGWYDEMAFKLSLGKSYDDIREGIRKEPDTRSASDENGIWRQVTNPKQTRLNIVDWLEDRYTPSAWYECK